MQVAGDGEREDRWRAAMAAGGDGGRRRAAMAGGDGEEEFRGTLGDENLANQCAGDAGARGMFLA